MNIFGWGNDLRKIKVGKMARQEKDVGELEMEEGVFNYFFIEMLFR